jgi:hypothetical protein
VKWKVLLILSLPLPHAMQIAKWQKELIFSMGGRQYIYGRSYLRVCEKMINLCLYGWH